MSYFGTHPVSGPLRDWGTIVVLESAEHSRYAAAILFAQLVAGTAGTVRPTEDLQLRNFSVENFILSGECIGIRFLYDRPIFGWWHKRAQAAGCSLIRMVKNCCDALSQQPMNIVSHCKASLRRHLIFHFQRQMLGTYCYIF
jgi:hypothetical protein